LGNEPETASQDGSTIEGLSPKALLFADSKTTALGGTGEGEPAGRVKDRSSAGFTVHEIHLAHETRDEATIFFQGNDPCEREQP
jgi:hypothetical protein